jgi:hypothetical protein
MVSENSDLAPSVNLKPASLMYGWQWSYYEPVSILAPSRIEGSVAEDDGSEIALWWERSHSIRHLH